MMKRIIKVLFVLCILFQTTLVSASTNTYERTEQDYRVPSSVTVTESNKADVLSTPSVDASEKIYDFADLFTTEEEQQLYNEVKSFIDLYDMDLAIVTIDNNPKFSQVEYADDFYDYNDFDYHGVLFLIDMDNRQIHMTTTGSAITMYNDYRINQALDGVYMYMSDGDYYEGTSNFVTIISDYASSGPPSDADYQMTTATKIMYSFIFSVIVTIITMVILVKKNKLVRKATTAKEYLKQDSLKITNLGDDFLGSNTVRHKIERSSSGGSSTHRSSSGRSHGGGSRGF